MEEGVIMPLHPTWTDIAVRLILTMASGAIIGFNRGARGEAAGLRTTILVGLAAAVAMIQANILLPVGGRTSDSFGVMDLMRLPLGILTGVGFIGAGAILRRGDLVTGVTTAATLWAVTVIGLCLGGGQIALGIATTILATFTLWVLKWVDMRIPREQRATLVIKVAPKDAAIFDLPSAIAPLGYKAQLHRQSQGDDRQGEASFQISWKQPEVTGPPLDLLKTLNERYSIVAFELTSEARH
jgi:putative Mg2+ transporter-C (MgtC) family protein